MSWKLRKDTDLDTGEEFQFFEYSDQEGNVLLVPEHLGFLLVKQLLKSFPAAIDALVGELEQEQVRVPAAPQRHEETEAYEPPQVPQPHGRLQPMFEEEEEEEMPSGPLHLPDKQARSLSDFAPREKDVPQY